MRGHGYINVRPGAFKAFSLVELVLVVAIMAIVGSIAVPRYAGYSAQRALESAERRIIADLGLAQRHARQTSASQTIAFTVGQSKYCVTNMSHPDHPGEPFEVRLGDEPYAARVISASFGGDSQLTYDGFGAPDSNGAIVIAVGKYQRTVQIDAGTGKAKKSNEVTIGLDILYPDPEPDTLGEPIPDSGGNEPIILE